MEEAVYECKGGGYIKIRELLYAKMLSPKKKTPPSLFCADVARLIHKNEIRKKGKKDDEKKFVEEEEEDEQESTYIRKDALLFYKRDFRLRTYLAVCYGL